MKFLVLALCVCAASAASFNSFGSGYTPYQFKPTVTAQAAAKFVAPVAPVAAVAAKTVVAPVAVVAAAPAVAAAPVAKTYNAEYDAPILRADSEVRPDGFGYAYETGNGIAAQSTGALKKVQDGEVLAIQGSYRYVAPDGTPVEFSYVADENGYQPQSNLLPVAPPVPEAILRSLEYIASHPAYTETKKY